MDVVLCVLRPKPGQPSQNYRPQLYEILLLDSKTPQGDKVKPARYLPMFQMKVLEDEPREVVLTQLLTITGIKGERALQIRWDAEGNTSHPDSLSKFSLFFVPVSSNDKIHKKHLDQTQKIPVFSPLDSVLDALDSGSALFPSSTSLCLRHLESWLREKHTRPSTLECLFRPRAEFRIHLQVNNPVFIPSKIIASDQDSLSSSGKTPQFPAEIQLTANEALAKMLSIEKCDIVVMNPLFGSGLPYKTKVNMYAINPHWPTIPNYRNINVSNQNGSSQSTPWRTSYPLHSAAAAGDKDLVKSLLAEGYSHSKTDTIAWAPIHYASWYGCVSVVEALLQAGCSPNIQDGERSTALHIAAKKGNPQLTACLLSCPDIDLDIRDKDNKLAVEVCMSGSGSGRFDQVLQMIRDANRRPSFTIEVFLMDKSSKTLQLSSGFKTTVQQLNQQMIKEFNMPKAYLDIFTLWICSKSLELQLKPEHEVVKELKMWQVRSVNMLTEADPAQEEPTLTWKRNVKVSIVKEKQLQHPKALELLFYESYHNYILGLYPNEEVAVFASIILTLKHHSIPSTIKSFLSNLTSSELQELIPPAVLRHKDASHWFSKISREYTNVKDVPPHQLRSQFLTTCQRLNVYGSAFFTGNIPAQQRKCYIGVNDIGVHLIGLQSKQMIQSLKYAEIKWKHVLERSLLEVKILKAEGRHQRSSPNSPVILEIRTRQAGLIDHLMQQLSHANETFTAR